MLPIRVTGVFHEFPSFFSASLPWIFSVCWAPALRQVTGITTVQKNYPQVWFMGMVG